MILGKNVCQLFWKSNFIPLSILHPCLRWTELWCTKLHWCMTLHSFALHPQLCIAFDSISRSIALDQLSWTGHNPGVGGLAKSWATNILSACIWQTLPLIKIRMSPTVFNPKLTQPPYLSKLCKFILSKDSNSVVHCVLQFIQIYWTCLDQLFWTALNSFGMSLQNAQLYSGVTEWCIWQTLLFSIIGFTTLVERGLPLYVFSPMCTWQTLLLSIKRVTTVLEWGLQSIFQQEMPQLTSRRGEAMQNSV